MYSAETLGFTGLGGGVRERLLRFTGFGGGVLLFNYTITKYKIQKNEYHYAHTYNACIHTHHTHTHISMKQT